MTVDTLLAALAADPAAALHLMLPDGAFVPAHFHVTEVGAVRKEFVDCGGARRSSAACVLQVWVADDIAHRLAAGKLAAIVRLAGPLLGPDDLPVEVEADGEGGALCRYAVSDIEATPSGLLLHLGAKRAACLAPERCLVPAAPGCASPGCC